MLHDILTAIISAWHFFIHTLQGIVTLVLTGVNALGIAQEVFNWLPSIVSGICMATILLLLVKFFIGRG